MKRTVAILLIAAILLAGCAVRKVAEPQTLPLPSAEPVAPAPTPSAYDYRVGALLTEQSEFNDALTAELSATCGLMAAGLTVRYAVTSEEQTSAAAELLEQGVQLLIFDPADIDNSGDILAAADSAGVPVINIMTPVNGAVATLISPDYDEMGAMLGRAAKEIGGSDVSVLVLGGREQDFIMQMETDGFRAGAGSGASIDVQYCGGDVTVAAQTVSAALSADAPEVIAAFDPDMAAAAAEAVAQSGGGVPIICIGMTSGVEGLLSAGTVSTAVYCRAEDIGRKAMFYAKMYFVSEDFTLPYYDTVTIQQSN